LHPRRWLIKAAKHRSLNMLRDRREAAMVPGDRRLVPREQPDPEEAEALAAVRSMLWALPESQHQAFVLRHWSGLSQDELFAIDYAYATVEEAEYAVLDAISARMEAEDRAMAT
jgi:DNA-directed RNA polymerase specialized sigma24 family protein